MLKIPGGRKKKYSFADDVMASDTKISLVFSTLSLLTTIGTVIAGTIRGGDLPDRAGILLLMSVVMAFTGLCFGGIAYRSAEGDNNAKRFSVILSLIAIMLLVILYVMGR